MKSQNKLKIAVFCSGFGSNLEAILKAEECGTLGASVAYVVCDKFDCYAIERARRHEKPTFLIDPKQYPSRRSFEETIVRFLKQERIGLVVLAGFMRILTSYFTKAYRGRILNIHPSLLPAFPGAHAIRDAYQHGSKMTGVTVHFVTEELDNGPILLQEPVAVSDKDSQKTLGAKIHQLEHRLYPKAIRIFAEKKFKINGRRVQLKGRKR